MGMDWKLELIVVPVSDVDRSKAFYSEQLGFNVDVDHHPNENFRVVQLTPPGSTCSITIGIGVSAGMAPGSIKGLHLIVSDIDMAVTQLNERGVKISGPVHFEDGQQVPGPDPKRGDYESFVFFEDPDGNGWVVQEVSHGARGS
jgi:catechol 2,3-dioxygenase-like lactoylglutathione lyase family enzyme